MADILFHFILGCPLLFDRVHSIRHRHNRFRVVERGWKRVRRGERGWIGADGGFGGRSSEHVHVQLTQCFVHLILSALSGIAYRIAEAWKIIAAVVAGVALTLSGPHNRHLRTGPRCNKSSQRRHVGSRIKSANLNMQIDQNRGTEILCAYFCPLNPTGKYLRSCGTSRFASDFGADSRGISSDIS